MAVDLQLTLSCNQNISSAKTEVCAGGIRLANNARRELGASTASALHSSGPALRPEPSTILAVIALVFCLYLRITMPAASPRWRVASPLFLHRFSSCATSVSGRLVPSMWAWRQWNIVSHASVFISRPPSEIGSKFTVLLLFLRMAHGFYVTCARDIVQCAIVEPVVWGCSTCSKGVGMAGGA